MIAAALLALALGGAPDPMNVWWVVTAEQGGEEALRPGTAWRFEADGCWVVQGEVVDRRSCPVAEAGLGAWKLSGAQVLELRTAGKDRSVLIARGPMPLRPRAPVYLVGTPKETRADLKRADATESRRLDASVKGHPGWKEACEAFQACCTAVNAVMKDGCVPSVQVGPGLSSWSCEAAVRDYATILAELKKPVPPACAPAKH